MLEVTQEKLREAAFFLRRLAEASHTLVGEEAEGVPYYLSAFLSAGRSVTFALQAEEKDGYDAWFPGWFDNQTEETRELFELMKGQRNQVLKRGRADIAYSLRFIPIVRADPIEQRQALAFQWFGPPGVPPPAIGRRVRHFQWSGTPAEVSQTCRRYLELLESLVTDFLRTHDPAAQQGAAAAEPRQA